MSTQPSNAAEALRYAAEASEINTFVWQERQILATIAQTFAQLAIADAINQLATQTTSKPNPNFENTTEPLSDTDIDNMIEALAKDLWNADPANHNNPARTFTEDYATTQDQYRALARAALGLKDEPKDKK